MLASTGSQGGGACGVSVPSALGSPVRFACLIMLLKSLPIELGRRELGRRPPDCGLGGRSTRGVEEAV